MIVLQIKDEASVDHTLENFAQAASQCYRAVIRRTSWILTRLGKRQNYCLSPRIRETVLSPGSVIQDGQIFQRRRGQTTQHHIVNAVGSDGGVAGPMESNLQPYRCEWAVLCLIRAGGKGNTGAMKAPLQ